MRRTCLSMSKSLSSIHTARSRWSGTSFSFQRNFGTRSMRSRSVPRTSSKLKRSDSDGSMIVRPPTCWCHDGVSVDRNSASVPESRCIATSSWCARWKAHPMSLRHGTTGERSTHRLRPARRTSVRYDPRHRPPQPPTPAPTRSGPPRAGGRRDRAGLRPRGDRRAPPAAHPRVPRDEAHLVAQHRAAGRAGFEVIAVDLRGAGDSDLSPDDEYDLGSVRQRSPHARARRPRPRALRRRVERRRWRRGDRHGPSLPRASSSGSASSTPCRRWRWTPSRLRASTSGRSAASPTAHRRLPRAAGRSSRRAGGDARHRPPAGSGWRPCTRAGCGHRPARSAPTTSRS